MKSNPSKVYNIKKKFLFFRECVRARYNFATFVSNFFFHFFFRQFFRLLLYLFFFFQSLVCAVCIGLLAVLHNTHHFFFFLLSLPMRICNAHFLGKPFHCYNYHYYYFFARIFTFIVDCLMHCSMYWRYEIATLWL